MSRVFSFVPLIGFWLLISNPMAQAEPLRVVLATGDNFPPHTDQSLPHGGMLTRIVSRSMELGNVSVEELLWLPWARAKLQAERGIVDGSFPWIKTPDREQAFLFSEPLIDIRVYVWVNDRAARVITEIDQLEGSTLCRPRGYADVGAAKTMLQNEKLVRVTASSMQTCFMMLKHGRVEMVVANYADAMNAVTEAELSFSDFRPLRQPIAVVVQHFIVGKQNLRRRQILTAFNMGLKRLKESGEFAEILRSYNWVEPSS